MYLNSPHLLKHDIPGLFPTTLQQSFWSVLLVFSFHTGFPWNFKSNFIQQHFHFQDLLDFPRSRVVAPKLWLFRPHFYFYHYFYIVSIVLCFVLWITLWHLIKKYILHYFACLLREQQWNHRKGKKLQLNCPCFGRREFLEINFCLKARTNTIIKQIFCFNVGVLSNRREPTSRAGLL